MDGKISCLVAIGTIVGSIGKLYTTKANYYKMRAKTYTELGKGITQLLDALSKKNA